MKKLFTKYTITAIGFLLILYITGIQLVFKFPQIGQAVAAANASSKEPVKASQLFSNISSSIDGSFPERWEFINFDGFIKKMIGQYIIENKNEEKTVYCMNNGQLTFCYSRFDSNTAVDNLVRLKEQLDAMGTTLIYFSAPFKIDNSDNELPYGVADTVNQNADELIARLKETTIPYIDYRTVLAEKEEPYASFFFNTDHHWTNETAFGAYQYLLDYLKDNYGFIYDPINYEKENFNFVTYKKSFIGSLANRVGELYAGVDDFTYIYPKFDTYLRYRVYSNYGKLKKWCYGTFGETIFLQNKMENKSLSAYRDNVYLGGLHPLGKITNNYVDSGRVLFVADSFAKPVISFMSLNFHEVDYFDLRDYKKYKLGDYLSRRPKYDYVIFFYYPGGLKESTYKNLFTFYKQ